MADGNSLHGLASCKVDLRGGIEQCFRLNRCFVAMGRGHQLAICPACNELEREYLERRRVTLVAMLKAKRGYHVRLG